jgi:hypothetical protein
VALNAATAHDSSISFTRFQIRTAAVRVSLAAEKQVWRQLQTLRTSAGDGLGAEGYACWLRREWTGVGGYGPDYRGEVYMTETIERFGYEGVGPREMLKDIQQ